MYVINQDLALQENRTVSVIDGQNNTVTKTIPYGRNLPTAIAYNPNNGDMYLTNFKNNTVSIVETIPEAHKNIIK